LLFPAHLLSWKIATHMIAAAMAYRVLQSENPGTAAAVQTILEKLADEKDAIPLRVVNPTSTMWSCEGLGNHSAEWVRTAPWLDDHG
jgi:hypothetical protein